MADSLREWLAEHPPPDSAYTQSLAGVAERVREGEDFFAAIRELLDEFGLAQTDEQRARALAAEPAPTEDPRHDAYLAALAEHLAVTVGLPRPAWAEGPDRFLDRFWFVSSVPGFRALALAESPAAFRRRGIFIAARSLTRV